MSGKETAKIENGGKTEMKSKTEIGKLLIYYMIDNETSIKALSEKMGVSRTSIYNWIAGKPMTNKCYIKLLKILDDYEPSEWVIEKSEAELKEYMFD